jgi:phosphohistidine phosphatase
VRVLIVRHAIAVERGTPGTPDDERPLTAEGERRFRKAAKGLSRILRRPDLVLTSPLPRARRTAEIAARAWGSPEVHDDAALAGGDFEAMASLIDSHRDKRLIALVGHEPRLSELLACLLGSPHGERLEFRKGGAALLELPGAASEGGSLLWFLPPRLLRLL